MAEIAAKLRVRDVLDDDQVGWLLMRRQRTGSDELNAPSSKNNMMAIVMIYLHLTFETTRTSTAVASNLTDICNHVLATR